MPLTRSLAHLLSLVAALTGPLTFAQTIDYSLGARAGLLANRRNGNSTFLGDLVLSTIRDGSQRPVFGPTFEIGFKQKFALEFSPTFRLGESTVYTNLFASSVPALPPGGVAVLSQSSRQSGSVVDLPLVGKYYFATKSARLRPFAGVGASATRASITNEVANLLQTDTGERKPQLFDFKHTRWGFGPVVSGGVEIRGRGRVAIVPEFRYVRDNQAIPGARNRAEFFLGFRF